MARGAGLGGGLRGCICSFVWVCGWDRLGLLCREGRINTLQVLNTLLYPPPAQNHTIHPKPLLQHHPLAIPQLAKRHLSPLAPHLAQRILQRPHAASEEPTNQAAPRLDLIMRGDPVPRPQRALGQQAVARAEIQLLGGRDAHVVQAVQEGEDAQRRVGERQGRERRVWDAVRRVEEGFCGGWRGVQGWGDGEGGAWCAWRVGGEGGGREGQEECGVVV